MADLGAARSKEEEEALLVHGFFNIIYKLKFFFLVNRSILGS
jgi:hypothetical protein